MLHFKEKLIQTAFNDNKIKRLFTHIRSCGIELRVRSELNLNSGSF